MSNIPDVLTGLRVLLAGAMGGAIVSEHWALAVLLLVVAILTDVLDGEAARLLRQQTDHGDFFDQLADAILLTSLFISLALVGKMPEWWLAVFAVVGISFQLAARVPKGSRWWFVRRHAHWMHPLAYGLTLLAGLVWLTYAMIDQAGDDASVFIMVCCIYAAAMILIISGKRDRFETFLKGP